MEAKSEGHERKSEPFPVTFRARKIDDVRSRIGTLLMQGTIYDHEENVRWIIAEAPCCADHIIVACARRMPTGEVEEHGYMCSLSDMAVHLMRQAMPDIDWSELDRKATEQQKNSGRT